MKQIENSIFSIAFQRQRGFLCELKERQGEKEQITLVLLAASPSFHQKHPLCYPCIHRTALMLCPVATCCKPFGFSFKLVDNLV